MIYEPTDATTITNGKTKYYAPTRYRPETYADNAGTWLDCSGGDDDTVGGCSICFVEWEGTYEYVSQEWVQHKHDLLWETRFLLDRFPTSFGNNYPLVEKLWIIAAKSLEDT